MLKKAGRILWNNIKILAGAAFVLATIYYSYLYLCKVFINKEAFYNDSFHNMPKDSVDIIVLGSSHAQYSFIPSFAYQDSGLYSYVLGSACQAPKVSYEMLKEALKNQSPELVILEVYTTTPVSYKCEGDVCFALAQYMMRGQEKQNVINFLPEEKAETYRNDFINNHNTWREMESLKELIYEKDTSITPDFGYIQLDAELPPKNSWYPLVYDNVPDFTLDEEDIDGLNNILDLCKEKDIQLLLYMMPMDSLTAENQGALDKVWQWADENDVKYLDFVQLSRKINYRLQIHNNGAHCFSNGASYITDYLMNFVKENYVFEHHTQNKELDSLYDLYVPGLTASVFRTEYNPVKYLSRLINYPDTYVIKYDSHDRPLGDTLRTCLLDMGLEGFDGYSSYYAIVRNGEVLVYSNTPLSYDLDGHHIEIGNGVLSIDENVINDYYGLSFTAFVDDFDHYTNKNINVWNSWDEGYGYDYKPLW